MQQECSPFFFFEQLVFFDVSKKVNQKKQMYGFKPKRIVNPKADGIGIVITFYKGSCSHSHSVS